MCPVIINKEGLEQNWTRNSVRQYSLVQDTGTRNTIFMAKILSRCEKRPIPVFHRLHNDIE